MSFALSQLHGFNVARRAGPILPTVLIGHNILADSGDKTVYPFSHTFDFGHKGPPTSNRICILVVQGIKATAGTLTVAGVTIGGVPAALLAASTMATGSEYSAIWGGFIGTAPAVTVQVTFGSLCKGAYIGILTIDNATTMSPQVINSTADTSSPISVPISLPVNGSVLATALVAGDGPWSWAGPSIEWGLGAYNVAGGTSTGAIADYGHAPFSNAQCTFNGLYASILAVSFR